MISFEQVNDSLEAVTNSLIISSFLVDTRCNLKLQIWKLS